MNNKYEYIRATSIPHELTLGTITPPIDKRSRTSWICWVIFKLRSFSLKLRSSRRSCVRGFFFLLDSLSAPPSDGWPSDVLFREQLLIPDGFGKIKGEESWWQMMWERCEGVRIRVWDNAVTGGWLMERKLLSPYHATNKKIRYQGRYYKWHSPFWPSIRPPIIVPYCEPSPCEEFSSESNLRPNERLLL